MAHVANVTVSLPKDAVARIVAAATAAERERIAQAIQAARDKWLEQITCEYDEGVADGHTDAINIARTEGDLA